MESSAPTKNQRRTLAGSDYHTVGKCGAETSCSGATDPDFGIPRTFGPQARGDYCSQRGSTSVPPDNGFGEHCLWGTSGDSTSEGSRGRFGNQSFGAHSE